MITVKAIGKKQAQKILVVVIIHISWPSYVIYSNANQCNFAYQYHRHKKKLIKSRIFHIFVSQVIFYYPFLNDCLTFYERLSWLTCFVFCLSAPYIPHSYDTHKCYKCEYIIEKKQNGKNCAVSSLKVAANIIVG